MWRERGGGAPPHLHHAPHHVQGVECAWLRPTGETGLEKASRSYDEQSLHLNFQRSNRRSGIRQDSLSHETQTIAIQLKAHKQQETNLVYMKKRITNIK